MREKKRVRKLCGLKYKFHLLPHHIFVCIPLLFAIHYPLLSIPISSQRGSHSCRLRHSCLGKFYMTTPKGDVIIAHGCNFVSYGQQNHSAANQTNAQPKTIWCHLTIIASHLIQPLYITSWPLMHYYLLWIVCVVFCVGCVVWSEPSGVCTCFVLSFHLNDLSFNGRNPWNNVSLSILHLIAECTCLCYAWHLRARVLWSTDHSQNIHLWIWIKVMYVMLPLSHSIHSILCHALLCCSIH